MFYSIYGLCPIRENTTGGYGFSIKLWPEFKQAVALRGLMQENINTALDNMGRAWLDACGFNKIWDPDNCGYAADRKKPPGPNARPMYLPGRDLRVRWGEWGPEHIDVPGNVCGLDLDTGFGAPRGGAVLHPHNVDHWGQVQLLLVTFCWFADDLALNMEIHSDRLPNKP